MLPVLALRPWAQVQWHHFHTNDADVWPKGFETCPAGKHFYLQSGLLWLVYEPLPLHYRTSL